VNDVEFNNELAMRLQAPTKTHIRYFIYEYSPTENIVRYREQTGSWVRDFEHANLWASREFVTKKRLELAKDSNKFGLYRDYAVYIGSAEITLKTLKHG